MKVLIALFCLISLGSAMTAATQEKSSVPKGSVAVIVKIEGSAKVLSKESIKKHQAKAGEVLYAGDKLITYAGTKAIVELDDHSNLVLNAGSELAFVDSNTLKQSTGEVYYKINTRPSTQGLKVETPFSIMGIKGTEFIVDSEGEGQIALNEGLVGIESLSADFELHKQKVMQEYEKFKEEQNAAFEAYKAEAEGEVITYVKAFDLEAGKVLNFSDAQNCQEECASQVNETEIPQELQKRFEMYQEMIE